jgi:hypothetical protein
MSDLWTETPHFPLTRPYQQISSFSSIAWHIITGESVHVFYEAAKIWGLHA